MGWFDQVMTVANPVTYLANGGSATSQYIPGNNPSQGGGTAMSGSNAQARQDDINAGLAKGHQTFYDDPDMQRLKASRESLAQGYDGSELNNMRATARGEIQGERDQGMQSLAGKTARAGVGGARAAAISGAADVNYAKMGADTERKMAMDSAQMKRQGQNDLQDFVFRQKYGELGTGMGYGQMGVADRSADAQAALANSQNNNKGVFGNLMSELFG